MINVGFIYYPKHEEGSLLSHLLTSVFSLKSLSLVKSFEVVPVLSSKIVYKNHLLCLKVLHLKSIIMNFIVLILLFWLRAFQWSRISASSLFIKTFVKRALVIRSLMIKLGFGSILIIYLFMVMGTTFL